MPTDLEQLKKQIAKGRAISIRAAKGDNNKASALVIQAHFFHQCDCNWCVSANKKKFVEGDFYELVINRKDKNDTSYSSAFGWNGADVVVEYEDFIKLINEGFDFFAPVPEKSVIPAPPEWIDNAITGEIDDPLAIKLKYYNGNIAIGCQEFKKKQLELLVELLDQHRDYVDGLSMEGYYGDVLLTSDLKAILLWSNGLQLLFPNARNIYYYEMYVEEEEEYIIKLEIRDKNGRVSVIEGEENMPWR